MMVNGVGIVLIINPNSNGRLSTSWCRIVGVNSDNTKPTMLRFMPYGPLNDTTLILKSFELISHLFSLWLNFRTMSAVKPIVTLICEKFNFGTPLPLSPARRKPSNCSRAWTPAASLPFTPRNRKEMLGKARSGVISMW